MDCLLESLARQQCLEYGSVIGCSRDKCFPQGDMLVHQSTKFRRHLPDDGKRYGDHLSEDDMDAMIYETYQEEDDEEEDS